MLPVFHFPILYLFPFPCCICSYVFPHVIPQVLCLQSTSVAQRQVERVWKLPLGWSGRGQVEWHLPDASWKGLDVWHKAAMIHWKLRCSGPKVEAELGELGALDHKCCCLLCFDNCNARLDFSRDFQMVVWFEHLQCLSTFRTILVAFLLILCGACISEQPYFPVWQLQ